ncbi:MAG: GTP cyclohydrolase [SAR324 cluster bacterium]|nr:GTP cyclohydrolase [SAR324 cluster bacterium]
MNVYVVILTYKVPVDKILPHVPAHREHLDVWFDTNSILFSGMQLSKTGGAIIVRAASEEAIQPLIEQDPFYLHDLADYQIIGVDVRRQQPVIDDWIQGR